jgi:hypothetical protein
MVRYKAALKSGSAPNDQRQMVRNGHGSCQQPLQSSIGPLPKLSTTANNANKIKISSQYFMFRLRSNKGHAAQRLESSMPLRQLTVLPVSRCMTHI